jgi:hypothetical protein
MNISDIPFFFIIGRPRSGTTLLRTLLDAHPAVKVPPEYPVILSLYNRFGSRKSWNSNLLHEFDKSFKTQPPSENWRYTYLRINEAELKNAVGLLPDETTFEDLVKTYYYCYNSIFEKGDVQLLGNKNPVFSSYALRLARIFPKAKFIFVTRDYRDNYLSIKRFKFEAPKVALQAYRWKYIAAIMDKLGKKYPGRVMHVRHEDLVAAPHEKFAEICKFLSIQFDPVVFDFYKKEDAILEIIDADLLHKFHSGLGQPINSERIDIWKQKMNEYEVKVADTVVGEWAEKLGYERKYRSAGFFVHLAAKPWKMYGWLLYKIMSAGEYLPHSLRSRMAGFLPLLAKSYNATIKSKRIPDR